jgi:NTE family protein
MARKKKENKRGLIISGGGAFGAYGVGTLAGLDKDYDVVAGISTGALMAGLVTLRKWDVLKEAYTSVTNESIFDKKWYRPHVFNKKGKLNVMSVLYVLINRIFGRRNSINTLATTNNMRKLIDKFLTEEDYNTIKNLNKEVVVAAVNINEYPSDVHYFSSTDQKFEDFKDWTWASANAPFVTTLLEKKWFDEQDQKWYMGEWTDGGLNELAPFDYVLQKGIKEVDIIMHRAKPVKEKERKLTEDLLENVERSIAAMRYDIEFEDGKLLEDIARFARDNGVKITVYWLPRKLADNSLVFDKEQMLNWYEEGFNTINDKNRIDIFE